MLDAERSDLHDLREIKFEKQDEGLWRRAWSMKLDGNPYPTNGLGPISTVSTSLAAIASMTSCR